MSALIVPSSVLTDTITRQSCFPEAKRTGFGVLVVMIWVDRAREEEMRPRGVGLREIGSDFKHDTSTTLLPDKGLEASHKQGR